MAAFTNEENGTARSSEGGSSGQHQQQRFHSGEALAELRSCEQVESGSPSTSPPYWDSDDDDDCGPRPSQLYGYNTWKIEKFSQITKRELRSNAFEVGGYKWYILIYPQGCDVCNHLSLFLCVANHDKLLPGWSHFAQFTIAVVNKDSKKSKYSDTLHRFWKKEHDWGWKKFMELSKVSDGFIEGDTLIIKAQVQVIREKADRPFRCLDCKYRRELIRVYLTNVEQICRRFVEERRGKLGKLIEDKVRWASFSAFWLGMDQTARRCMSREKSDSVLKVVVKHFFIEKEVTSTLVMDSLHSGMKALEGQTKSKKNKGKYADEDDLPVPIVRMEKDMFVLVDDVLLLLERAAMEPLPPKDEKGPQNRTKDGSSGEDFNKEPIERDERRLTELGRRTLEIFVLAHIFSSKIEVAYQEAVAFKRQEELIREEEAAGLAETEQKSKRGAPDKEKKSKKKQVKQKRNNRKGKDKGKDEKSIVLAGYRADQDNLTDESKDNVTEEPQVVLDKADATEDVSDVSDSIDCSPEVLQPDCGETSLVNWDTDTSEAHPLTEASSSGISSAVQNGARDRRNASTMDDSSSTCSTDSVPSVVMNGPLKGNNPYNKNQKSPKRSNGRNKATFDAADWPNETCVQSAEPVAEQEQLSGAARSGKAPENPTQAAFFSLQDRMKWVKSHDFKKEEEADVRIPSTKEEIDFEGSSPRCSITLHSSPRSPSKNVPSAVELKSDSKTSTLGEPMSVRKQSPESPKLSYESARLQHPSDAAVMSKSGTFKSSSLNTSDKAAAQQMLIATEKPSTQQAPVMSRPLSAPLVHVARSVAPVVSMVQTTPLLARSVSAAGRLGPEASTATHSYIPLSYRNVMMGSPVTGSSVGGYTQSHSPSSGVNSAHSYSQPPTAMLSNKSNFTFGMVNQDAITNGQHWMNVPQRDSVRDHPSFNDMRNFDMYTQQQQPIQNRSQDQLLPEFPAGTSGRHTQGFTDEFPHLDIINDLLDDDGKAAAMGNTSFHSFSNGPGHLSRHFSFPGDIGISNDLGPSTSSSSSCRFERTLSYHEDALQRNYVSMGSPYDAMPPPPPPPQQPNVRHYGNGQQIEGMLPNQWQMSGNDSSSSSRSSFINNMRNMDNDGYPYNHHHNHHHHQPVPAFLNGNLNLACGVNGYTMFRPSNGH